MSELDLPRDLWLRIYSAMDMDTRIKAGLVFKLRVPDGVASRLAATLKRPVETESALRHVTTIHLPDPSAARYMIRRTVPTLPGGDIVLNTGTHLKELFKLNVADNAWAWSGSFGGY